MKYQNCCFVCERKKTIYELKYYVTSKIILCLILAFLVVLLAINGLIFFPILLILGCIYFADGAYKDFKEIKQISKQSDKEILIDVFVEVVSLVSLIVLFCAITFIMLGAILELNNLGVIS